MISDKGESFLCWFAAPPARRLSCHTATANRQSRPATATAAVLTAPTLLAPPPTHAHPPTAAHPHAATTPAAVHIHWPHTRALIRAGKTVRPLAPRSFSPVPTPQPIPAPPDSSISLGSL